jgi:hypothetical protein
MKTLAKAECFNELEKKKGGGKGNSQPSVRSVVEEWIGSIKIIIVIIIHLQ